MTRLLRVPEAAAALGVSVRTVYRLIDRGSIKPVVVGLHPPKTRIPEASIKAYVKANAAIRRPG